MVKLKTISRKGNTINLPHTEHNDGEKQGKRIRFDSDGYATVTPRQAKAVEEFYGDTVEVIKGK